MFCKNCGKEIKDDAVFCKFCGVKQEAAPAAAQESNNPAMAMKKECNSGNQKSQKRPANKKLGCGIAIAVVLIFLLIGAIVGGSGESEGNATTKKPTTERTTEAIIEISAEALINEYKENEIKASQKYKGKRLRITGLVDSVGQNDMVVLNDSYYIYVDYGDTYDFNNIRCSLNNNSVDRAAELKNGDKIVIEGRCDGFSVISVDMYDCVIVN